MGITEQLARHAIECDDRFLTPSVVDSAKARLLDTLACMLAGSQSPAARIGLQTVRALGGTPQASVLGWRDRTSLPDAGFVNGLSAHALEYDDNTEGVGHVSGCILPGVLAVAEQLDLSGRRLIEGFAIGFEVFSRIARGLRPFIIDKGWHPQAVIGGHGVAVAACRLSGFDTRTARMAMGLVASSACGVRKNVGSMGKAFHVGNGVRAGLLAVLLARSGFEVDPDIIEGSDAVADGHERFGLADTFNGLGNHRLERIVDDLGGPFELGRNTTMVRLHPGSSAPGAAIDGMIDLSLAHGLDDAQVDSILLECTPQCLAIAPYAEPVDVYKAKFCLPYTMAVALIDRKVGLEQYTPARIRDERVPALMRRVSVVVPRDLEHHRGQWGENGVNWGVARITVRLRDGRTLRQSCSHAKGWPARPASWQDLCGKFEDCAAGVLDGGRVRAAIAAIATLETLVSVRELIAVLTPGRAA